MKNQNDHKIIFEMNIKIQAKDYRLKYLSKKYWIIILAIIMLRIIVWLMV